MAIRPILTFPNPLLQRDAHAVANIDGTVATLLADMTETMYAAPGVGLAATQVGVDQRIIVLDIPHEGAKAGETLLKLVNPVIAERDGTIDWEEACLSVPDLQATVTRARRVLVKAWTLDQQEIQIEAEGLLAVAFQHEIDHLDGTLFLEHLSRLKREMYKKRQQKLAKQGRPAESGRKPHLI